MENPLPGNLSVSECRSLPSPCVLSSMLGDHLLLGSSEKESLQRRALLFSKMLVSILTPPPPASALRAPPIRSGLPVLCVFRRTPRWT